MKTRVIKRYVDKNDWHLGINPYYEVDVWHKVFWKIGYWKTHIRTVDFNYATSVFNEYKAMNKLTTYKDATVLIHYEEKP